MSLLMQHLPVAGLHLRTLLLELGQGHRVGRLLDSERLQLDGCVGDGQVLPRLQLGVGGLLVLLQGREHLRFHLSGDLNELLRSLDERRIRVGRRLLAS